MLKKGCNNVTSDIHEFKCTKDNKSIDQSKCAIILVYNGLNYYAGTLPPALRDLYYKKTNQEKPMSELIMKYQEIQQMLPTFNARANMDRALLHLHAADNLIKAAELTSGAGDITASKEVAVRHPQGGTCKRTRQNNPKPHTGENDTQNSADKDKWSDAEKDDNNSSGQDNDDGTEKNGNNLTNDGVGSQNTLLNPPKNSTARKANQCWCGLVYDSNAEVEDHIKLDHSNNSFICSGCKQVLGTQQSLWSHFRKKHLGLYQYTCQELKNDSSGEKCDTHRDELSEICFHLETKHGKGRTHVRCQFCDIPLLQHRSKKEHEAICKKGELATKEKRFICEYCDKGFRGTGNFRNHMKVLHWKELEWKEATCHHCDECGLDYANPSSLKNHVCKPDKTVTATATSENESDGNTQPPPKRRKKKNKKSKNAKKKEKKTKTPKLVTVDESDTDSN